MLPLLHQLLLTGCCCRWRNQDGVKTALLHATSLILRPSHRFESLLLSSPPQTKLMALARSSHRSVALLNTVSPTRKTLIGTGAVLASVAAISTGYFHVTPLQAVSERHFAFHSLLLFHPRFILQDGFHRLPTSCSRVLPQGHVQLGMAHQAQP